MSWVRVPPAQLRFRCAVAQLVERRKTSGHHFVDRVFCITTHRTHWAAGSEYMHNNRKV